jgi:acyl-CoA synthetase (AMP-forming)/AMP-acid ligase II
LRGRAREATLALPMGVPAQPPLPAEIAQRTVRDLLDHQAVRNPERAAVIAESMVSGEETSLTYAQLRDGAQRLAAVLASAGVGRGDRVAILLTNEAGAEAHTAYHASHRIGAINVPLNTRYVERELAYALEFTAPAAIVFEPRFADVLGRLREPFDGALLLEVADAPALGTSLAAAIASAASEPRAVELAETDDADWIFTSGTTGKPKAVALTHGASVACGHQATNVWGLDGESVYQSFAPFFTSSGCHTNLLACLAAGCTYVVEREFDVRGTLERMARHGTTSAFLISSVLALMFARLSPEEWAAIDLPKLRRVVYGAQPMGPAFYERVWREVGQAWDVELVNVYGLTEGGTSGIILTHEDHPEALKRLGSYGLSIGRTPFAEWVDHAVLGPDDAPVAPGEVGELCLRGPSTMSRYVRDPEATQATLRGGWLRTGDMATVDDAGFVYYVDRAKQIIRRGGLNISSAEIEGVLEEHPGVAEVAAVPMPNEVLGEDVRAVVVASTDPPPSAEELIAFCRERLADYKVPRRIDFIDALPRNAMGRVMKPALTGQGAALDSTAR